MMNIRIKCYFSSLIYRFIITLFRSIRLSRLPSISNAAADVVTRSSRRLRRVVSIRERYAAISERGHASRKNRTFLQKFLARENDSPCPLLSSFPVISRFPFRLMTLISRVRAILEKKKVGESYPYIRHYRFFPNVLSFFPSLAYAHGLTN